MKIYGKVYPIGGGADAEEDDAPKKSLDLFIDTISGIFTPVLGVLTASGMVKGSIFQSPVHLEFLGIPVLLMNYASSVIPIILAVFVGSKVEKFYAGIVPTLFKSFGIPFLTILTMIPLTLLIVEPVGALIGGGWQIFVIFGLHWGLVPIMIQNIVTFGADPVIISMFGASFAQIGVVLAILLRTKDQKLKGLAIPAFLSGIFGVTEPAIYGVTLPRKKFFIISCIGAAIGGALIGFLGVKLYIFGGLGVFQYPCFIDPATNDLSGMYNGMIVSAVAFIAGFAMAFPLYKDEAPAVAAATSAPVAKVELVEKIETATTIQREILSSPLTGELVALPDVPDEVFASGMLGKGIAVNPSVGKVFAPADAEVTTLFPTGHAIGLKTAKGAEMLIHIGMDTVKMNGDGFKAHVAQGDKVTKGQLLIEFDIDKIKKAGYPVITPVLVTNADAYKDIVPVEGKTINNGENLISVVV